MFRLWLAIFISASVFMGGCSVGTRGTIEKAEFELDSALYSEAITTLELLLASEPTHLRAQTLLASALFGRGFLGASQTYLGLFASFLEYLFCNFF